MNIINTKSILLAVAAAGVAAAGVSTSAQAADGKEKCYGVAKAGQNDCATANSSCAGTSRVNGQGDAFILVPKGMCAKLVGGTTAPRS